jgi:hypothetical protein
MRGWKGPIVALSFGTLIAVAGTEWWASSKPPVRVQQVFDSERNHFDMAHGVPVWTTTSDGRNRWNSDCARDRGTDGFDVAILGSSIFFGVRLAPELTMGALLQSRLEALGGQPCVTNLAQPGYGFDNQYATMRQQWSVFRPRVVVWEVWHNSPNQFVLSGDRVFNFGSMARDSLGFPNPFGLSSLLNRWLFNHSGAYRFANLSRAGVDAHHNSEKWSQLIANRLGPAVAWMAEQGARVLLVYTPPLRRPFRDSVRQKDRAYSEMQAWADDHEIPTFDLAQALVDEDPNDIGIDACCHFNARGTFKIAAALEAPVAALLSD